MPSFTQVIVGRNPREQFVSFGGFPIEIAERLRTEDMPDGLMMFPCRLSTHSWVLLSDAAFVWQSVSEWCRQVGPWALTHEVQVMWASAHFLPCVQHGVRTYPKTWYYVHPAEWCWWQTLIGRKGFTTHDLEVQISVGCFIWLLHLASVERKAHYVDVFFNGYSSQSNSCSLLLTPSPSPSPPLSSFLPS